MSTVTRRPGRRRATQIDVARLAGVSQATVSTVLKNPESADTRIPASTRDRVLAAAAELGYAANPVAQRLVGGRAYLLAFHTFEAVFPVEQRDFYFPFLLGVESEASSRGYDLMLLSPSGPSAARSISRRLLLSDGAIFVGRHVQHELLAELTRYDFPFVLIGRRSIPGQNVPFTGFDYPSATATLVGHLRRLGHRRLGYIGAGEGGEQSEDRLEGYWRGVDAAGIREGSVKHSRPLTVAELHRWTTERQITAVLVEPGDDDANVEALEQAAAELGLRVPEDLSVVVLGDPPFTHTERDWTRFALPRLAMGEAAVAMLTDILDGGDGERHQLVEAEVILTDTIGPVPEATKVT